MKPEAVQSSCLEVCSIPVYDSLLPCISLSLPATCCMCDCSVWGAQNPQSAAAAAGRRTNGRSPARARSRAAPGLWRRSWEHSGRREEGRERGKKSGHVGKNRLFRIPPSFLPRIPCGVHVTYRQLSLPKKKLGLHFGHVSSSSDFDDDDDGGGNSCSD